MVDSVQTVLGKFTDAWLMTKGFVYGIFISLNIDVNIVKILAILMLVDTVLGVIKTLILGKSFSFKKLIWGLVTKGSVLIVPMILALTAQALSFDFTWFVDAVLDILVVSETYSTITNIISIKEKRELANTDYVSKLLTKVRGGVKKIIDGLFKVIDADQDLNNEE